MTDPLLDRLVAAVGTHYLIDGEIGRGGMAVVYRATDLRLNRTVAIKVLPPELAYHEVVRTRFVREAQTAAQLTHPSIVPIYSVDERDGIVYFVMAYVDGDSVGAILRHTGAWPIERAQRVLREVAGALAYANGKGVVHRDVKPDNIIVEGGSGRAMVTDFGIAFAAAGEPRLTVTGVAVGTPAYMSPEQALGERDVDARSDIYSLGVVAYEMLTGHKPFRAVNTPAMLLKHISELPQPVRELRGDVPGYMARAVERTLAKRPQDRFASAADFRDALSGSVVPEPEPPRRFVAERLPPHGPAAQAPREPEEQQQKKRLSYDDRPLVDRVISFRRAVVRAAVILPPLAIASVATGAAEAVVILFGFPAVFFLLDVLRRGGSIWSDGVGPLDAFKKGIRARLRGESPGLPSPSPPGAGAANVSGRHQLALPDEVLAGPHGRAVAAARADREAVLEILAKLRPLERELIPDIEPTVHALVDRIVALAGVLHRLDRDVSGASLGVLDERLAALRRDQPGAERDRRLSLLDRQRASLHDLLERRRTLASQLESATLALQNLKLDLMKLRSAGVGTSLEDVTSATKEARALSRDIGHVLEAAEELKRV